MDRLRPPELPTIRLLKRIQQGNYATTLAKTLETLNRQSALLEATQTILCRPAMLDQVDALTQPGEGIRRRLDGVGKLTAIDGFDRHK